MNVSFRGQVAMTLASRPMASARQSKNMWMAGKAWGELVSLWLISQQRAVIHDSQSEIRPRLLVQMPYLLSRLVSSAVICHCPDCFTYIIWMNMYARLRQRK